MAIGAGAYTKHIIKDREKDVQFYGTEVGGLTFAH